LRLLDAFDVFKSRTGSDVKLVVAGKGLYKVDEIYNRHKRMQSSADVIFTGRMDDDKLNKVLAAALALTFVPIFEGFGIPIIEAMQCDVPVICSNVTSMPEVAGEAALLVDPTNVEQIAQAMVKVFEDKKLRKELIEKGRLQKEKFSWERSANLLWGGVTKCL
jgi:glycosyltransferase involved in cell wall biosynthesis